MGGIAFKSGYDVPKMANSKKPGGNRILIMGASLVALLALVAFLATKGDDDTTNLSGEPSETQAVSVTGTPLPKLTGGDTSATGLTAPSIDGKNFAGSQITIAPSSHPKLVVFVAHWCPHCQREVPKIAGWLDDKGKPEGLEIIVVATATDANRPNYPPSEWLQEEGLDLPTLADDSDYSAAAAMGLGNYPYFVLLDADNKVLARDSGELEIEQLDALVALATDG